MAMLVSILIPAYNAEKWIADTMKSAMEQTWRDKEIIVVDDGSTDGTLRVAKTFESRTVKVVTQPNMGASTARNRALSIAQGDYIQWLDADDLLAPNKISEQLAHADNGTHTKILLSSAFGTFYYNIQRARFVPNALWRDLLPVEWMLTKFNENTWMSSGAWLVSRELTDRAGPWDERLSLDDDGEYFNRVVAASEMVEFIPIRKSYYRQLNLDSLSRRTSAKACNSLFLSVSLSCKHLRSLEDTQRTRNACLRVLQTSYDYFYPEEAELLVKVNDLACELGGAMVVPKVGWKYLPLFKILGWKAAKNLVSNYRNAKLMAQQNWDRLHL